MTNLIMDTVLALVVLFGLICIASVITTEVNVFLKRREIKKKLKIAAPIEVDETRLCKSAHTWSETPSLNENGETLPLRICTTCGFLPSHDKMVTQTLLDEINTTTKRLALENEIIDAFEESENQELQQLFADELKAGMAYEKAVRAYRLGYTQKKRLILFRIAKLETQPKSEPTHD